MCFSLPITTHTINCMWNVNIRVIVYVHFMSSLLVPEDERHVSKNVK